MFVLGVSANRPYNLFTHCKYFKKGQYRFDVTQLKKKYPSLAQCINYSLLIKRSYEVTFEW